MFNGHIANLSNRLISTSAAIIALFVLAAALWLLPSPRIPKQTPADPVPEVFFHGTLESEASAEQQAENMKADTAPAAPSPAFPESDPILPPSLTPMPEALPMPTLNELAPPLPVPAPSPAPVAAPESSASVTDTAIPVQTKSDNAGAVTGDASEADASTAAAVPSAPEPALRQSPRPAARIKLNYPRQARLQGIEGRVTVRCYVSAQGKVETCRILSASPQGIFEEAAIQALKNTRFHPAVNDKGKKCPASVTVPISFKLY